MEYTQNKITSKLEAAIVLLEDEINERKEHKRYLHLAYLEKALREIKNTTINLEAFFVNDFEDYIKP